MISDGRFLFFTTLTGTGVSDLGVGEPRRDDDALGVIALAMAAARRG